MNEWILSELFWGLQQWCCTDYWVSPLQKLLDAAHRGNLEGVKDALEKGANINVSGWKPSVSVDLWRRCTCCHKIPEYKW